MNITPLQAHVLENLDRVLPLVGKNGSARPRYQLDGKECTAQIVGLGVRRLIARHATGNFRRLGPSAEKKNRVGDRQAPLPYSIDAIRALLTQPADIQMVGTHKR